jgi:predicted Zn-dependent peptidase
MHSHHPSTLPNGLRVVTVETPQLHSAMLAVYVRAGSRHETPETNGVSHFLEHVFFRGCERFPEGRAMNARVEDAGGSLNGMTARDHGYYFTPLHPAHVEVGVETLGAMLARPLFKELEIEREVILEEMLDELDDAGRDVDVDNVTKRHVFGAHPLGLKIAGTRESVGRMDRARLEAHHRRFYVARNMVLVVAGPVAHEAVLAMAERHFGAYPAGEQAAETPPPAWPDGPQLVEVRHDESQTEFRAAFPAPTEDHPDYPALMVLRRVLDDGLSTRFQVNVVERKGLAYSIQSGLDTFADAGLFEVDAACAHAKVPATFDEVLRTLGEVTAETVPADELERAKRRFRVGFDFMQDSASDLAGWYGGSELFRTPTSFARRIAEVEAVTAADVMRVARSMFRKRHLVAATVGKMDAAARRSLARAVARAEPLPG